MKLQPGPGRPPKACVWIVEPSTLNPCRRPRVCRQGRGAWALPLAQRQRVRRAVAGRAHARPGHALLGARWATLGPAWHLQGQGTPCWAPGAMDQICRAPALAMYTMGAGWGAHARPGHALLGARRGLGRARPGSAGRVRVRCQHSLGLLGEQVASPAQPAHARLCWARGARAWFCRARGCAGLALPGACASAFSILLRCWVGRLQAQCSRCREPLSLHCPRSRQTQHSPEQASAGGRALREQILIWIQHSVGICRLPASKPRADLQVQGNPACRLLCLQGWVHPPAVPSTQLSRWKLQETGTIASPGQVLSVSCNFIAPS